MTLGLNITEFRGAGRPAQPLTAHLDRELSEADMALLATTRGSSEISDLKRITDRHHSLARLLASGMKEGDAAFTVGLTPSRVSVLTASPAFQELLDLYRNEVQLEFSTVLEHMAGLSRDALLELRERLETDSDKFSNRELMSLVTELTDRSVDDGRTSTAPTRIELVSPVVEGESGE